MNQTNQTGIRIIGIILILCIAIHCSSIPEEINEPVNTNPVKVKPANNPNFNDSVKLKNGTIIESVKVVVTKESLVLTDENGKTNVYSKKEVSDVVKNGKFTDAKEPAKKVPANTSSGKWSDYQGSMNWKDATAKCASFGMWLPTIEELKTAYTAGVRESEGRDGVFYQYSKPYGNSYKHFFIVGVGGAYHGILYSSENVLCRR